MKSGIFIQTLSLVGAFFILVAYIGHQFHWLDSEHVAYNLMNAVGAAMLAYVALRPFSAGFVMLEGTWTVVSLIALYKGFRSGSRAKA
jgi:hypothetical protein